MKSTKGTKGTNMDTPEDRFTILIFKHSIKLNSSFCDDDSYKVVLEDVMTCLAKKKAIRSASCTVVNKEHRRKILLFTFSTLKHSHHAKDNCCHS